MKHFSNEKVKSIFTLRHFCSAQLNYIWTKIFYIDCKERKKAEAQMMLKFCIFALAKKQPSNVKCIFLIAILVTQPAFLPVYTPMQCCSLFWTAEMHRFLHTPYAMFTFTLLPHLKNYIFYLKENHYYITYKFTLHISYETHLWTFCRLPRERKISVYYTIKCGLFNTGQWIAKVWISNDNSMSK